MEYMPYLRDRGEVKDAAELITMFGDDAGFQAAARAVRSRERADDPAGLGPLLGAGLLAEEGVQVLYRNFEQQWPSGIALDGDGLLRIELWPAWSSQRQGNELSATGLHWLDDMQHTVKEFVLNFGPLGSDSAAVLARQFQFPPVVALPYAWYSATRVTGDLGGHFPPPPTNLPDYLYWNAGISYTYKNLTADVRSGGLRLGTGSGCRRRAVGARSLPDRRAVFP